MKEANTLGLTSEKAEKAIGNKFDMIIVAVRRARELGRGARALTKCKGKNITTALQEIEEGKIGREYLVK